MGEVGDEWLLVSESYLPELNECESSTILATYTPFFVLKVGNFMCVNYSNRLARAGNGIC